MPGFVIHLAIGKEYIKKHDNEIKNMEEFMKGVVAPDLNEDMTKKAEDKNKTHYGKWVENTTIDIEQFLQDKKINMENDYWKGYYMHLLTDYYFCNIDFKEELKQIIKKQDTFYFDYDCLNKELIKKYNIKCTINYIREYMNCIDEHPKYLEYNKIIKFIEKISNLKIEETIKIIKEKGMEGLK